MPLPITLATNDPRPVYRQIVDEVRRRIANGQPEPGAKLPSVRALAIQLSVNPNTVAKAYTELANEGLIESRVGLGVFVTPPRIVLSEPERERRLDDAVEIFINDVLSLGYSAKEIADRVHDAYEPLDRFGRASEGSAR